MICDICKKDIDQGYKYYEIVVNEALGGETTTIKVKREDYLEYNEQMNFNENRIDNDWVLRGNMIKSNLEN